MSHRAARLALISCLAFAPLLAEAQLPKLPSFGGSSAGSGLPDTQIASGLKDALVRGDAEGGEAGGAAGWLS